MTERRRSWNACAGGCGEQILGSPGTACRACWARVPQALRREYDRARQACSAFGRSRRAVQDEIQDWWRKNPAPPRVSAVPAWKRDHRGGKR